MLLHQRVDEEMRIMLFLLDQEYGFRQNPSVSEKLNILLERAMDS